MPHHLSSQSNNPMRSPRCGYRLFTCPACLFIAKWPSRDCYSPSIEHCPECSEPIYPHGYELHPEWPVDAAGNLIRQES